MDEFDEFCVRSMTGGRRLAPDVTKQDKQESRHHLQQVSEQQKSSEQHPSARTKPPLTRWKQSQWHAEDTLTVDITNQGICNNDDMEASCHKKELVDPVNKIINREVNVFLTSESQDEPRPLMANLDYKPAPVVRGSPARSPARDRAAQLRQSEKKLPPMRQMSSPGPVRNDDTSINKHARSQSCRKPVRPTELKVEDPPSTKPKSPAALRTQKTRLEKFKFWSQTSISEDEVEVFYTARTFVTSHKGIVKRGSTIRMRTFSRDQSLDCCSTPASCKDDELLRPSSTCRSLASSVNSSFSQGSSFSEDVEIPTFKVVMCGASGVGKSSLAEQFISSEYSNTEATSGKCFK